MKAFTCRALFERQTAQAGGVCTVNGGPTVLAFACMSRDAFLSRHVDQHGHEAMVAAAMYRGRQANNHRAHALRQELLGRRFRDARVGRAGGRIGLGRQTRLGRAPTRGFRAPEGISPRLQRVLDALQTSPAYVKTPTWDLLAWNHAARAGASEPMFGPISP